MYSDGENVARKGKATQIEHRPRRRRRPGHRRQHERHLRRRRADAHRRRATDNPWWEVDLGPRVPDRVGSSSTTAPTATWARGSSNYTLKVLDADRNVVFEKAKNPTPAVKAAFAGRRPSRRSGSSAGRRCSALTSVRGKEADDVQGHREVRQGRRRPRTPPSRRCCASRAREWPKEEAKPLLDDADRLRPQAAGGRADHADGRSTRCSSPTRWRRCCRRTRRGRSARSWARSACA